MKPPGHLRVQDLYKLFEIECKLIKLDQWQNKHCLSRILKFIGIDNQIKQDLTGLKIAPNEQNWVQKEGCF